MSQLLIFAIIVGIAFGEFVIAPLPWAEEALEPVISAETISFHYGKHHQGYVNKLNSLAEIQTDLADLTLEEIIQSESGKAYNLAAQIYNHQFFWEGMIPGGSVVPGGDFEEDLSQAFGSIDGFKSQFQTIAGSHFGSGWCWLVWDLTEEKLEIVDTHDAGNPIHCPHGCPFSEYVYFPLFVVDVWEHAYYLDYQNKRGDYLAGLWEVVNWEKIAERYEEAKAIDFRGDGDIQYRNFFIVLGCIILFVCFCIGFVMVWVVFRNFPMKKIKGKIKKDKNSDREELLDDDSSND